MSQEKKRRPQVLLCSYKHADRWGDGYEDCIYLRKMGDGSLKLVAIKYFQGRKQLLDAVAGIRTVKRFDSAFGRISGVVNNDGYTDELFDQVGKLAPELGEQLRAKFLADEDEAEEVGDELEAQS